MVRTLCGLQQRVVIWMSCAADANGLAAKIYVDVLAEYGNQFTQPGHSTFDVLHETGSLELRWRAANGELRGVSNTAKAQRDHLVAGFDVHTPKGEMTRAADQVARLRWHALYLGEPDSAPSYAQRGLPGAPPKNRDLPRTGGGKRVEQPTLASS